MGLKPSKKSYNLQAAATASGTAATGSNATNAPAPHLSQPAPVVAPHSSQPSGLMHQVLCSVDEMKDGEMRQFDFEIDGEKRSVLLVKDNGQFFATGAKCTHYGAPLVKGSYCNGRVRCPWHGACFRVDTGDIEDCPGIDSLPKFPTIIKDGMVVLQAQPAELAKTKRVKRMVAVQAPDGQPVVIVGGGAAAASCAEALRQEDYGGRIVILSQEPFLPYDRPKLSKAANLDNVEDIQLRPADFYATHRIEILRNKKVVHVDTDAHTVRTEDGDQFTYKTLVVATGGTPRRLTCPGHDLGNVFYLRTPEDTNAIMSTAKGKNVVVIGSSFIGMELASLIVKTASSTTAVDMLQVPFELVLGKLVGASLQKLHESNGVKFRLGVGTSELRGDDSGRVTEVVLSDGSTLPADMVVVGIGVIPVTDFLRGTPIELDPRGYVKCDENLRSSVSDVYACGDIVTFPLSAFDGAIANVQHWQMALKHGMHAARAIAGRPTPITTVPFFWTVMFGKSIRYTGYGYGYDDILMHGNVDEQKFVCYYLRNDRVVAVSTLNRDPVAAQVAHCFSEGILLRREDVERNETDDWTAMLSRAAG